MASISLVIPVFNEEKRLGRCLPRLHSFLTANSSFEFQIVIANNASADRTQAVAEQMRREFPCVRAVWVPQKGRGGAIKKAWLESDAEILAYMDVDLSTDLTAFPLLVEAIASRGFDLAAGSRLLPESHTQRSWRRELTSRCYIRLVRAFLHARLSDTQCGFKAISRTAAHELLPLVEDSGWFFDTELLVLAERLGYRICEVPVHWVEDPDSRVKIVQTALGDLRGLLRMRRSLAQWQRAKSTGSQLYRKVLG